MVMSALSASYMHVSVLRSQVAEVCRTTDTSVLLVVSYCLLRRAGDADTAAASVP